jgi:hypothetical protein
MEPATTNRKSMAAWRRISSSLLVLFALAGTAAAQAPSQVCRQLEAQLSSTNTNGSAQAGRFAAAISRQQEQIRKAKEQSRQAGCGRAIFGASVAACAWLNATLQKMQLNLIDLQGQRARLGGGDDRRERARILAAIDVNGCRRQARAQPDVQAQPRQRAVIDGRSGLRIGGLSGNFRTLCVRTCDGYFFPISYGVTSSAFERDRNACSAMCPGTEVELHYHRVPDEESSDMVSVSTGLPYSRLPNAWRYRDAGSTSTGGCGCGAGVTVDRGFEVIGGSYQNDLPKEEAVAPRLPTPLPAARPDPAEDPETLANRDGGLDASTMRKLITPRPTGSTPKLMDENIERNVRVVGPVFLPDPEEAIDLRAPAQPVAR